MDVVNWVTSIGVGVAGTTVFEGIRYLRRRYRKQWANKGQRELLAGITNPLFIYPPRDSPSEPGKPKRILNQLAIEDFMAINNLISAFLAVGVSAGKARDTQHASGEARTDNDLVLVCSSRSNEVTKEALQELDKHYSFQSPMRFAPDHQGHWLIELNGGKYESASFAMEEKIEGQDNPDDPSMVQLRDSALIVKACNPWAPERKLLIVAGVRGIGTWGAAECLKKKIWKKLHAKKGAGTHTSKSGDFAAVVDITYQDCDIKIDHTRILTFVDLDELRNRS